MPWHEGRGHQEGSELVDATRTAGAPRGDLLDRDERSGEARHACMVEVARTRTLADRHVSQTLSIRPQLTCADDAALNADVIMEMQARVLWDALVFRTPVMLRIVEGLSDAQLRWLPPNGVNSIAWLLWHIAEVEDHWIREKLCMCRSAIRSTCLSKRRRDQRSLR